MVTQTIALEDIKEQSLEQVLRKVVRRYTHLIVQMPDGEEVVIGLKPRLKPLPVLDGYVPEDWKEAIYANHAHPSPSRIRQKQQ